MKKIFKVLIYIATVVLGCAFLVSIYMLFLNSDFYGKQGYQDEGLILDETEGTLSLTVTLLDEEQNAIHEAVCYLISDHVIVDLQITDSTGHITFEDIFPGEYLVQVALSEEELLKYKVTSEKKVTLEENEEIFIEVELLPKRLVLRMVGDNLIHSQINHKAYSPDTDTYQYEFLYAGIQEELETADIAIINQETIFVADHNNISTYPRFGTPTDMGESLRNVGFDVICCASNHTADKGELGVTDSLAFWEKYPDITICGIYSSQEDKDTIRVVEKNGIKVAILNYTYGLNGLSFPSDKQYLTNMLDSKERIKEEILHAKEIADVVVVSPHMGTEYAFKPNDYQKDWIALFVEAGADVVIGTHPHVLEPCVLIEDTVVFYSLGNFVSNQKEIPTILGGMAEIIFEKNGDEVTVSSYQCIPLVTHYTDTKHMVYKLSDYTEELAREHTMNQYDSRFSKEYVEELYDKIMHGMDEEVSK